MLFQNAREPALYTVDWLKEHGPRIGVLLALAALVSWLGRAIVRRFRRRLEGGSGSIGLTTAVSLHRTTTLAGAGVVGIALGFGAQSLVKDFLAGFFILFENQFGVGESVEISATGGTVTGRVEALTLRSTAVREDDGTVSVVPN